jgi:hypothetical protein
MECIVTIGKRKIEIVGNKKIIANVLKDIAKNLESEKDEE